MTTALAPTTYADATGTPTQSRTRRPLLAVGLAAGLAAAAANVAIAAAARGLDVSLKLSSSGGAASKPIPVAGFATMTLIGMLAGLLLAGGSVRWATRPATRFTTLAIVGTVLSLVPAIVLAADAATMLVLVVTHVTAAVIIVTSLAARLPVGEQK
jgi:hypothetical protein